MPTEILNSFLTNPVYSAISFVTGMLGIVLTFVFYFRGKVEKIPCYSTRSNGLISPFTTYKNPIKVLFADEEVKSLSVTYIVFWNNGKATITADDIKTGDPLRIVIGKNHRILSVEIVTSNRPANNFHITVSDDGKSALITFDFVDYRHGVVFCIHHTGFVELDEDIQIDVIGTVKGVQSVINTEKHVENGFSLMNKFRDKTIGYVFDKIPYIDKAFGKLYDSQNFALGVLMAIPVYVIMLPLMIVFLPITMIIFLSIMFYSPIISMRYSTPEELYRKMRRITH